MENTKNNTFQILNNGKVMFDELKYVGHAESSLQVLNNENEIFYLNDKLETVSYPEKRQLFYCGTVDHYSVEIMDKKDYYLIKKTIDPIDSRETILTEIIDSISKKNINDICFLNGKKSIEYDDNFYFPETLIIESKNKKFGIKTSNKTEFYEEIDYDNPFKLKIKKNGLWGYLNITKIKYKTLNNFVFNLASFELENGQKGYIDTNGKEYF
ncbi:hypothetical protein [Ulvibacter litoralis]|nr:hypothetical protein [Ulvibacter litoralis]GHC59276.1 hypothetical protein GCM10008083_25110 [Ulvibacter litoralis]